MLIAICVGCIAYLNAMWLMWTEFPPSWIPGTTETSGEISTARAEIRGLGVLPVNGVLGRYLHTVVVDDHSNGSQYVMTDFRRDNSCSFVEKCSDGRVVRVGRFMPLPNPIPEPQESQMFEGTTFDADGKVIGVLRDGNGFIEYEDCTGRRARALFK